MRHPLHQPHPLSPICRMPRLEIRKIGFSARQTRRSLRFARAGNVQVFLPRVNVLVAHQVDHVGLRIIGLHLRPPARLGQLHILRSAARPILPSVPPTASESMRPRPFVAEIQIRRRVRNHKPHMDSLGLNLGRGRPHHRVSLHCLPAARVPRQHNILQVRKHRPVRQAQQQRIQYLVRADSRRSQRRPARLPRARPPAHHLARQPMRLHIVLIQKLRRDQDAARRCPAGLVRRLLQPAIVAIHIPALAVQQNHRSRNPRLRLRPVQRNVQRNHRIARRRVDLRSLAGDDLHRLLGRKCPHPARRHDCRQQCRPAPLHSHNHPRCSAMDALPIAFHPLSALREMRQEEPE